MVRKATAIVGLAASGLAVLGAWSLYLRRTTESVPYRVVARVGDVELRRYPALVQAETIAPTVNEAFGRLFRYISGTNRPGEPVEMTAPVELTGGGATVEMTAPVAVSGAGAAVAMTTPVESTDDGSEDGGVRMAFYLPADYDLDSAPVPTDDAVELVTVPERTLAVGRFTGRPTAARIDREAEALRGQLAAADVETVGDPFFLGYDAPWTLPFLRRNEVAVEVVSDTTG